jgi:homocysteine S-methyltransferase
VAGSAPTLEDCFRPELVPDDGALAQEHAEHAAHLAAAGVDAILVETMNTSREAMAAVRAARGAGVPVLASFVCWEGPRLLSGEALEDALASVATQAPLAVLVNCLPPSKVAACLPALRASGLPFGAYANLGEPEDERGHARSEDCAPEEFAEWAAAWLDTGARIVGGCCGTSPAHVRAIAQRMRK